MFFLIKPNFILKSKKMCGYFIRLFIEKLLELYLDFRGGGEQLASKDRKEDDLEVSCIILGHF